jgi:hypothetical protein
VATVEEQKLATILVEEPVVERVEDDDNNHSSEGGYDSDSDSLEE